MRRLIAWAGLTAAVLVLAAGIGLAGLLVLRGAAKARDAAATAIPTPDGIDWGGFVDVGGERQWVRIRGWHRSNPVLLILHGGPTDAQSPLTVLYAPLEQDFTVVQWDQRGAGKSYGAGSRLTPATPYQRLVDDGLTVTAFALRKLDARKLILVGHSAGSFLGLHMIQQRADLFFAYVGTGQIVSQDRARKEVFARVLAAAKAVHDAGTLRRMAASPPPWRTLADWLPVDAAVRGRYGDPTDRSFWRLVHRPAEPAYALTSPELSLQQLADWDRATRSSIFVAPYAPVVHADVGALGKDFHVPIFVIQGRNDWITPTDMAEAWLESLHAPGKAFVQIDGGHWGAMTHMAEFHEILVTRVRPLAGGRPES